jgi:hypothetical protein
MNVYENASRSAGKTHYPESSWQKFRLPDDKVAEVFKAVEAWEGWRIARDPQTQRRSARSASS